MTFNILMDAYPEEWNGYKLNTDFRVALQIYQASEDENLTTFEKTMVAVNLLFADDYPQDSQAINDCLNWFLNDWTLDRSSKSESRAKVIDFDVDQGRIYAAFMSQYRIDLNIEDMHFWKFMHLLTNLEECSFTRVIDIRTKDLTKCSKYEREYYQKAKKMYSLDSRSLKSEEEKLAEAEVTETFLKLIGESNGI